MSINSSFCVINTSNLEKTSLTAKSNNYRKVITIEDKVELLKALGDKNRLLILDMLSCGELCACDIMEGLNLTQPTISHHMKILQQCELVDGRKEGKWVFYSINTKKIEELKEFITQLTSLKDGCICEGFKQDCTESNRNKI